MAELAQQFDNDGYAVLENLFSEEQLRPVSEEVDRVIDGRAAYVPASDLIYEPGSNPPRLRNAFRLHLYNDLFLRVPSQPALAGAVESILGSPVRLYSSGLFAKPAEAGSEVPRHQDMPYWPFEPYEMLTAWIALDDSTLENGCVRYAAGSHKLGLLPHQPSGVMGNSLGLVPDDRVLTLPEQGVELRCGDCVLHHCLTVHRSEPNRSSAPRRGLIYTFMSPQVRLTDASRLHGPALFPTIQAQAR
jgi:phytanoyl-CoA hydroxylase